MSQRKIIHLDLDAFFCSVEEQKDARLKGKPFAVGGKPESRGVVASCSYAARQFGIHSAMPMSRAVKICPDLIIIPPHREAYIESSNQVMRILGSFSSTVEQLSIDEAFLDLSEKFGELAMIARNIQMKINQETKLPCSLGAGTSKLIAKTATDFGKARHKGVVCPNVITIVNPGGEKDFLSPLPVKMLWGVGEKTADRLQKLGVTRIGQLAELGDKILIKEFGKNGYDIWQRSLGIDNRPVISEYETKSISQEITFERDTWNEEELNKTIEKLTSKVAFRLNEKGFSACTVKLKLRWSDFSTVSRQVTLPQPTEKEETLLTIAKDLFYTAWKKGKSVRLLGVGVSNLCQGIQQLTIWDIPNEKDQKIADLLDNLGYRFGDGIIFKGNFKGKRN